MIRGFVNPLRLFFGPVFQMEVRTAGRRSSTYVFRFVFAAAVIVFFAIRLFADWGMQRSGMARIQQIQNIAPDLTLVILWTQYVALVALAPIITGPALCDERRQRTLAALLTTPLSAWEIVMGKLTGRLTQAFILGVIALPVMLGVRLLGGVAVEGILLAVLLTVISVVQIASLALLLSARSTQATTAASAAALAFLLINLGPIIGIILYNSSIAPALSLGSISSQWIMRLSLPVSFGGVVAEYVAGEPTGVSFGVHIWGWAAVYGVCVAVLAVLTAGLRLRAVMREAPDRDRVRGWHKRRRHRAGTPLSPGDPALGTPRAAASSQPKPAEPEESRPSREVGDRPVLWRELRQRAFLRRRSLVGAFAGLIVGVSLLYIRIGLDDPATHQIIAAFGFGLLLLQTVHATTGLIPKEREAQTLDILLTTPLRPLGIITGKLVGAASRLWLIPLFLAAHFGLSVAAGFMHPACLILLPLAWGPAIFLLLCTGMLMGVLLRRAIAAGVANTAIPISLYVAFPLILAMTLESGGFGNDRLFYAILQNLLLFHPFFLGGFIVDACDATSSGRAEAAALSFNLPAGEYPLGEFAAMLALSMGVQLVLGVLAIAAAAKWLPHREGRPA